VWGRRDRDGEFRRWGMTHASSSYTRIGEDCLGASWKRAVEQGNRANTHLSVTSKVLSELSDLSRG
jgi:hypothetical protein